MWLYNSSQIMTLIYMNREGSHLKVARQSKV